MIEVAVDSSAMMAMVMQEPDALRFRDALLLSEPAMSCGTRIELGLIIAGRLGIRASPKIDALLAEHGIRIVPVDEEQTALALAAMLRFGKGRRSPPAALNFGGLFSYALAKARDMPLLYKGKDFSRTDIVSALDVLAAKERP